MSTRVGCWGRSIGVALATVLAIGCGSGSGASQEVSQGVGPTGTTFSKPVQLTVSYKPESPACASGHPLIQVQNITPADLGDELRAACLTSDL